MRLFATGATGYNFAMFILTSEFFVVVVLHDRSIVAERTSGEPFNRRLRQCCDTGITSRIASPDSSLSRSASVFTSTNRRISSAVNSALHPETSIHLKVCLLSIFGRKVYPPLPTTLSAFRLAQSRQNICPSAQEVMQFAGHSSKQQPLLSAHKKAKYHSNNPPDSSCNLKLSALAASSSASSMVLILSSSASLARRSSHPSIQAISSSTSRPTGVCNSIAIRAFLPRGVLIALY